jgi:hypothetical protein
MDQKRFEEIEKVVTALSFSEIQKLYNFWTHLEAAEISLSDLKDYVFEVMSSPDETHVPRDMESFDAWPKCPRHPDRRLDFIPIPERDNEKKYKNRWVCHDGAEQDEPGEFCGFEILDTRSRGKVMVEFKRTGKITLPEAS